tara:strand:+ start:942 stop:2450 length:1509 start_codon:yes stop_codon:yes gene_type:complete
MAKGNYTNAYVNAQPSGFNPTKWLQNEQDRQIAIDEISRKRDEEDRLKKEKQQKNLNEDSRYKVKIDPSEIQNVNDYIRYAWEVGKERVFELSNILEANKDNQSSDEYRKAQREIALINDNLGSEVNFVTKAWESDMTKAASGKYLLTPEQLGKTQSYISKKITLTIGDGGRLLMQRDTDGDGTLDVLSKEDFANGNLLGQLVPNVDENAFVKGLNIGNVKVDDIQGLKTTTIKNPWDANVFGDANNPKSLNSMVSESIKSQILDSNGNLNELGKSFAYKRGMFNVDNISKDEIGMIVEDLADAKRAEMGFEKTIKTRNPVRTSGGSGDKTENTYDILAQNRVRPTKSVWGDKFEKISPENRFSVPVSKSVKIGSRTELQSPEQNTIKDLDSGKSYSNATIESYTYDDKGNLYAKISYVTDKGVTETQYDEKGYEAGKQGNPETKKTAIIRADSDTKRDIANFLGISMDDLWNLGVEQNKTESGTTDQSTPKTAADIFKKVK